jgi:hypothetical protein
MTKTVAPFIAKEYSLKQASKDTLVELTIIGERVGKPSKRLSLKQSGLKVVSAAIRSESKNKVFDYDIMRINHLPVIGEVRLHTKNLMYPGRYQILLTFSGRSIDEINQYLRSDSSEHEDHYWPTFGSDPETEIKIT